jgi:hypothetical protein
LEAGRKLLALVGGSFTEGFNTFDVEEAKPAVAELALLVFERTQARGPKGTSPNCQDV